MSRPDLSLGGAGAVALDVVAKLGTGPVASTLSYCASSISMTVVNKYVVSGDKWNMNFLFLVVQSVIGATTLVIGREAGLIKNLAPFSKSKAQQWFPVSLCLVGMVYTGNMALRFLSVPVYTIFKNLTIIVIAYGEVLWFAGSITPSIMLSFALMILSSVVAAWADLQYATSAPAGDKASESIALLTAGFIWMTLNIFCSAAYALSLRKFTKMADFTNWDIMYYNNLLIFPVVCVATLVLEDWSSDNLRQNFPPETRYTLPMGMIYSGLGALAITYCAAWVIRTTSSTTYAMIGALNKLPLAVCGIIFFASPVTFGSVSAIALGFVSGLVYAWAKVKSSSRPQPKSEDEIPLAEAPENVDTDSGSEREDGAPSRP